jgi:hypothetical protein
MTRDDYADGFRAGWLDAGLGIKLEVSWNAPSIDYRRGYRFGWTSRKLGLPRWESDKGETR